MEIKKSKIFINKGGSGGVTFRVTLPTNWVREMEINEENRELLLTFENNKIIIEKVEIEVLMDKIEELNKKYEDLTHEINLEKAHGDLGKLANLQGEFDTTFDYFFDSKEIAEKYGDWDEEEGCRVMEKSNMDILEELDEKDLLNYIEFYQEYIGRLEDELMELQSED